MSSLVAVPNTDFSAHLQRMADRVASGSTSCSCFDIDAECLGSLLQIACLQGHVRKLEKGSIDKWSICGTKLVLICVLEAS
jgi:hypothetical protein